MGEDSNNGQDNTIIAEIRKKGGAFNTSYDCRVYTAFLGEDEKVAHQNGSIVVLDSETDETRPIVIGKDGTMLLTDMVLSATQASKSKAVRKINQGLASKGSYWRVDSTDIYML